MANRYFDNSFGGLNESMDHGESAVNRSFATATSLNSSTHTTASSSKAVLAALRALQDKIRRLEAERSQALDEASDLRSKIKSYEIESEHSRQRDAMHAQRQIQEAKGAYDKLLQEKKDLEERLRQIEDRNKRDESQLLDLTEQTSRLSENKSLTDSKIRELSLKVQSLESQLQTSQQREKELTHAMIRETKRHEDEQQMAKLQADKLADDLAKASSNRVINETKLSELDHLVGQLLSVNESLLRQLSGKAPMKPKKTVSSAVKGISGSSKKPLSSASKISKLLKSDAGNVNVSQLAGMHEMYRSLAKSIVGGGGGVTGAAKKTKKKTRMSKKKTESESSGLKSGLTTVTRSSGETKKVNIRLPATTASSDFDHSFDQNYDDADPSSADYQNVISSLEDEFDELNDQYRKLLSSASVPSSAHNNSMDSFRSDQLVDVIQKLHKKGEQLRAIKSPPRSLSR